MRQPPVTVVAGKADICEAAIDRALNIYGMMGNRSAGEADVARSHLSDHIDALFESGEHDSQRLVVCGLTYLRELEHRNDPRRRDAEVGIVD